MNESKWTRPIVDSEEYLFRHDCDLNRHGRDLSVPDIGRDVLLDECGREINCCESPLKLLAAKRVLCSFSSNAPDPDEYPFHAVTFGDPGELFGLMYNDHSYAKHSPMDVSREDTTDRLALLAKLALAKDESVLQCELKSQPHPVIRDTILDVAQEEIVTANGADKHIHLSSIRGPVRTQISLVRCPSTVILNSTRMITPTTQTLVSSKSKLSSAGGRAIVLTPGRVCATAPIQVHRVGSLSGSQVLLHTGVGQLPVRPQKSVAPMPTSALPPIRCICGYTHDDGCLVQCVKCRVLQHADCVSSSAGVLPSVTYLCDICQPRQMRFAEAVNLQRQKLAASHMNVIIPSNAVPLRIANGPFRFPTQGSNFKALQPQSRIYVTASPNTNLPGRQVQVRFANTPTGLLAQPVAATPISQMEPSFFDQFSHPVVDVSNRSYPNAVQIPQMRSSKRKQDLMTLAGESSSLGTVHGGITHMKCLDESESNEMNPQRFSPLHRHELTRIFEDSAHSSDIDLADNIGMNKSKLDSTIVGNVHDAYEEVSEVRPSEELQSCLRNLVPFSSPRHMEEMQAPNAALAAVARARRCRVANFDFNRKGLVATEYIYVREPIVEYFGYAKLLDEYAEQHDYRRHYNPYVLFYTKFEKLQLCVDAQLYGNDARYIRRSCNPNCDVRHVITASDAVTDGIHCVAAYTPHIRLVIIASRDIPSGAELTLPFDFDYSSCRYAVKCACSRKNCAIARWFRYGVQPGSPSGTSPVAQYDRSKFVEYRSNNSNFSPRSALQFNCNPMWDNSFDEPETRDYLTTLSEKRPSTSISRRGRGRIRINTSSKTNKRHLEKRLLKSRKFDELIEDNANALSHHGSTTSELLIAQPRKRGRGRGRGRARVVSGVRSFGNSYGRGRPLANGIQSIFQGHRRQVKRRRRGRAGVGSGTYRIREMNNSVSPQKSPLDISQDNSDGPEDHSFPTSPASSVAASDNLQHSGNLSSPIFNKPCAPSTTPIQRLPPTGYYAENLKCAEDNTKLCCTTTASDQLAASFRSPHFFSSVRPHAASVDVLSPVSVPSRSTSPETVAIDDIDGKTDQRTKGDVSPLADNGALACVTNDDTDNEAAVDSQQIVPASRNLDLSVKTPRRLNSEVSQIDDVQESRAKRRRVRSQSGSASKIFPPQLHSEPNADNARAREPSIVQSREEIWMAEVLRRIERMEKKQKRQSKSSKCCWKTDHGDFSFHSPNEGELSPEPHLVDGTCHSKPCDSSPENYKLDTYTADALIPYSCIEAINVPNTKENTSKDGSLLIDGKSVSTISEVSILSDSAQEPCKSTESTATREFESTSLSSEGLCSSQLVSPSYRLPTVIDHSLTSIAVQPYDEEDHGVLAVGLDNNAQIQKRRRSQAATLSDALINEPKESHISREDRWLKQQLRRIAEMEKQQLQDHPMSDIVQESGCISQSVAIHETLNVTETSSIPSPCCKNIPALKCASKTSRRRRSSLAQITSPPYEGSIGDRLLLDSSEAKLTASLRADSEMECELIVYKAREKDPMAKFSRSRSAYYISPTDTLSASTNPSEQDLINQHFGDISLAKEDFGDVTGGELLTGCNIGGTSQARSYFANTAQQIPRPSKKRWLSQALMEEDIQEHTTYPAVSDLTGIAPTMDKTVALTTAETGGELWPTPAVVTPLKFAQPTVPAVNPKKRIISQLASNPPEFADDSLSCRTQEGEQLSKQVSIIVSKIAKVEGSLLSYSTETTGIPSSKKVSCIQEVKSEIVTMPVRQDLPTTEFLPTLPKQSPNKLPPKKATVKKQAEELRLQEMRKVRMSLSEYRRRRGISVTDAKEDHSTASDVIAKSIKRVNLPITTAELPFPDVRVSRSISECIPASSDSTKPEHETSCALIGIMPNVNVATAGCNVQGAHDESKSSHLEHGPRTPSEPPDDEPEDDEVLVDEVENGNYYKPSASPGLTRKSSKAGNSTFSSFSTSVDQSNAPEGIPSQPTENLVEELGSSLSSASPRQPSTSISPHSSHHSCATPETKPANGIPEFPLAGGNYMRRSSLDRPTFSSAVKISERRVPPSSTSPPPPPPPLCLPSAEITSIRAPTYAANQCVLPPPCYSSKDEPGDSLDYIVRRDQEIRVWQETHSRERELQFNTGPISAFKASPERTRHSVTIEDTFSAATSLSRRLSDDNESARKASGLYGNCRPSASINLSIGSIEDVQEELYRLRDKLKAQLDETLLRNRDLPKDSGLPANPTFSDAEFSNRYSTIKDVNFLGSTKLPLLNYSSVKSSDGSRRNYHHTSDLPHRGYRQSAANSSR